MKNGKKGPQPRPVRKAKDKPQPQAHGDGLVAEDQAKLFQLKAHLEAKLEELVRSGHYVIYFAHLNGSDVKLWRKSGDFPVDDFDVLEDLISADIANEKTRVRDIAGKTDP